MRALGHDYSRLVELVGTIEPAYLSQWATSLRQGQGQGANDGETAARRIGAHLLDAGFSPTFLHRWWTRRIRGDLGIDTSLADILDEAHQLVTTLPGRFRVLVAFAAEVPLNPPIPDGWLNAKIAWRCSSPRRSRARSSPGWRMHT